MIFHHLLTTEEPIKKPHLHLGCQGTALLENYKPIPQLDSTIMRTCRLIYSEALPILYGQNTFEFASVNEICSFQSNSLVGYPIGRAPHVRWDLGPMHVLEGGQLAFNFRLARTGRLTLLRSVIINLISEFPYQSLPLDDRDSIWRGWYVPLRNTL